MVNCKTVIFGLASLAFLQAFSCIANGQSADTLSLEGAVRVALEHNFSIRIAENKAEIARNNRSPGAAGFLPVLFAEGSRTVRVEDSKSEFAGSSIPDQDVNGARTDAWSAQASLEWTIFDGLAMFTTYERLGELQSLGEIRARSTIEVYIAEVTDAYFDIVRQQNIYVLLASIAEVSRERIEIAETRKNLGSGSEYELLQARADLNADRSAMKRQEAALENAKVRLNELMGRSVSAMFSVDPDISVNNELRYADLRNDALSGNLDLAAARTGEKVSALEIKEIRAERFPEISLNAGYGYNKTEPGSGILELSQSNGFNYGVTARIDLFDGFSMNRRLANAKIEQRNLQLVYEELQNQVEGALANQYNTYVTSLELTQLEEENLTYARQSLDIALERYELGTITSIELREAQNRLLDAESRLIQAQYEVKQAETELLRLSNRLLER